jgi:adenine-specific DNA-methyltransferase
LAELIWEGKYDKDGHKVAPLRVRLPFQTVETVNESAQERQTALDLFASNRQAEWRNRLIWGDKKYVLPALLEELAGQVNLIYIDPPFDTGADFTYNVRVDGEGFVKEPSILEQKAYRDTWGKGIESYIHWFYETAILLRELLHNSGSIYVHLDWHVGHYVKIIMDEIFGKDNFRNEIYCKRIRKNVQEYSEAKRLNVALDTILFYSKSTLHRINQPRSELVLEERWHSFDAPELRQGMDYEIFGVRPPPGRHWMWEGKKAQEAIEQGVLRKMPRQVSLNIRLSPKTP